MRVAEALGATNIRPGHDEDSWYADWPEDRNPYDHGDNCCATCDAHLIANYDTDWSATGPLVEKYAVDLSWHPPGTDGSPERWMATAWIPIRKGNPQEVKRIDGPTPLIAVCDLLLALKDSGKL